MAISFKGQFLNVFAEKSLSILDKTYKKIYNLPIKGEILL